jgi:dTDP-4-dehydrorhamnose reductase
LIQRLTLNKLLSPSKIILLGGRSWLGFWLQREFARVFSRCAITSTTRDTSLCRTGTAWRAATTAGEIAQVLQNFGPDVVVNLLWWEDGESMFAAHQVAAKWCEQYGAFYCYASSALALDGYGPEETLTEEMPPRSISPYGRLKARGEDDLATRQYGPYLVMRFASIQGWSPWKPSRNQVFLQKLSSNTQVAVARGIWQNRAFDQHLAAAVIDLVRFKETGVVHIGTTDSSEEFNFLRKVAAAFGYDPGLLRSEGERRVNLVMTPGRLMEIAGGIHRHTEEETLAALVVSPNLQIYRRNQQPQ